MIKGMYTARNGSKVHLTYPGEGVARTRLAQLESNEALTMQVMPTHDRKEAEVLRLALEHPPS